MSLQDRLLAYAELDREQRALCAGLDAAARRLLAQKKKADQLAQEEKELHALAMHHKAQAKNHEVTAQGFADRIASLREKMNEAKNNNAYQALLVEVSIIEKEKAAAEEASLESTGKAEAADARAKESSGRVAEHHKIVVAAAQEVATARDEINARLVEVRTKRDAAGAALPPKVLELCQKLADRLDGDAVCMIGETSRKFHEYSCEGCSMKVPRQLVNALLNQPEMPCTCSSCGRLLAMPADLRESLLEGTEKKGTEKK